MSDQRCRFHMDGGILDIGTRYAVYGTALLTIGLGCLSMFSVRQSMEKKSVQATPITPGLPLADVDRRDDDMYESIRSHKKSMRPVSTTLNLTGAALVCAAFVNQSNMVRERAAAKEEEGSTDTQGPFTLFHAYTLLSLLWLIALVGMMIHVQTWVFNVIRRQSGVVYRDRRRFLNCIWNGTHWYLLQVELLGVYGYYVSTNRHSFPTPPCNIPLFNHAGFRMFARVVYIIAMIPIVNVGLLCVLLVGTVWMMSWVATYLSSQNSSKRSVSPLVFNFFWLLVCVIIIVSIGATTEILLFTYTDGQNVWAFGSLLALILLLVPVETFVGELYSVLAPEAWRHSLRTSLGTHRYDPVHNTDEGLFPLTEGRHLRTVSMPEPDLGAIGTSHH